MLEELASDRNTVVTNNQSTNNLALANNNLALANNNSMNWINSASPTDSLDIVSQYYTTTHCYQAETREKFSSLKNMVTNSNNPFISKFSYSLFGESMIIDSLFNRYNG